MGGSWGRVTGPPWAKCPPWRILVSPVLSGFSQEVMGGGRRCGPGTRPRAALCCGVILANRGGPGTWWPGASLAATTPQLAELLGLSVPPVFSLSDRNGSRPTLWGTGHGDSGSTQSTPSAWHTESFPYLRVFSSGFSGASALWGPGSAWAPQETDAKKDEEHRGFIRGTIVRENGMGGGGRSLQAGPGVCGTQ